MVCPTVIVVSGTVIVVSGTVIVVSGTVIVVRSSRHSSTHLNSALSVDAGSGSEPSLACASSNFLPSCRSSVQSPPAVGCDEGGASCRSVDEQAVLSLPSAIAEIR